MMFPDGFKRAGFFDNNIYRENLETLEQLTEYIQSNYSGNVPEFFKQELKEYLGYYDHNSEDDENYIDKEFKKAEKEDPPEENAFKYMQELIND